MFFGLKLEVEKKGKFGMREFVPLEYDWDSPNAQGNLSKYEFPNFEPVFSDLVLTKNSIQADFISDGGAITSMGFIVSDKVKDIFSRFNIGPHRYYPLRLVSYKHNKAVEGQYFWLQIKVIDNYDWINFTDSEFQLWDFLGSGEKSKLNIINKKQLEEAADKYKGVNGKLTYSKIKLSELYQKHNYDLFYLFRVVNPTIVTKRLKEQLEQEKVTGLEEFKELKILI